MGSLVVLLVIGYILSCDCLFHGPINDSSLKFTVDCSLAIRGVSTFWNSTGLCPPDPHQDVCTWLLSESSTQNIALISAIPHSGIRRIRVHWLLDAVTVNSSMSDGNPVFNFTCLDEIIHLFHVNGLVPGFELMGNPGNYFTDFSSRVQLEQFADLVHSIALRYIGMFGLDYVAQWYFESWNEPKLPHFDGLNMTVQEFLNYYDAISTGLKRASDRLQIGGPGGACSDTFNLRCYCWALLDHVVNGYNTLTGNKDVPLDFISIHKKGEGTSNTQVLIDKEFNFVTELKKHLPKLLEKPLFNDEADPQVSWEVSRQWQADSTYAAMAVKIIVEHQNRFEHLGVNYALLSNDNAFLSYQPHPFSQRTLLARFQVNSTRPPHIQLIRKPIYAVMSLLSLVYDNQVLAHHHIDESSQSVNLLATVHHALENRSNDSWQASVVLYNSVDTLNRTGKTFVELNILGVPRNSDVMQVIYLVDNKHVNPFSEWKAAHSPATPSAKLFRRMRRQEEPFRLIYPQQWSSSSLSLVIKLPGVVLVHLCARSRSPPNQVTGLVLYNITCNQVRIVWSDTNVNSKCILTYVVEFSRRSVDGPFFRVNSRDSFHNSFVYDASHARHPGNVCHRERTVGFYRVRPIDYWNRTGMYSKTVAYPSK